MAGEYSRFFGGPAGSVPEYTQPQFAEVLKKIFSDGVFTDIANELEVVETDPVALAVRVNTGEAWIQGFWYQNTAYLTKSLAAADPDNDRIDRIVLRLDTVTNFKISIEVLTGTPAGSPAAPDLTQTASTYEISLAQVLVGATETSVANAKITDERTYAGISNAPVTLTNVATLTNKTLTSPVINPVAKLVQTVTALTPAGAGTSTCDLSLGNIFDLTMPANTQTLAISNGTTGQCFIVNINNVTSQGALTWFTTIRWADGSAPTLTGTNGKRDTFGFIITGAGTYDGYIVGQNL
jgi:hypothetical protein